MPIQKGSRIYNTSGSVGDFTVKELWVVHHTEVLITHHRREALIVYHTCESVGNSS